MTLFAGFAVDAANMASIRRDRGSLSSLAVSNNSKKGWIDTAGAGCV